MKVYSKAACLFILSLILLTACSEQGEAVKPTEVAPVNTRGFENADCDRAFAYAYFDYAVCSTENVIYYTAPELISTHSWIHFWDKKSGLTMPLCSKADCLHDNESCQAFFEDSIYCLSAHGDELFWLGRTKYGEYRLYSCQADGSARKEYPIENSERMESLTVDTKAFIHRGYVYFQGMQNVVQEGEPASESYLFRCPLTGGRAEVVLYEPYNDTLLTVQAVGDSLFIVRSKTQSLDLETETFVEEVIISQLDCKSLKESILFQEICNFAVNNIWVTETGIFLSTVDSARLHWFDFATGKISIPFVLDPEDIFVKQIYFGENRIIAIQHNKDFFALMVRDFEGNILLYRNYEVKSLEAVRGKYFLHFQGIDQNNIFIYSDELSSPRQESLLCFPLDGSDPLELWIGEPIKINGNPT